MYLPIICFCRHYHIYRQNMKLKKNLKNLDKNENIMNKKILMPMIPEPKHVILYGKGEKPPIIISNIPTSVN